MNSELGTNDERSEAEERDQLSMEELMKKSMQSIREGEVVHGVVVAVTQDEVMIDIGFKCEGSVPVAEFTDPRTGKVTVDVDDDVEVFVLAYESPRTL